MKIALIGPELEENLALRYIHASVVRAGCEAEIFDFHEPEQIPELAAEIVAYQPEVVGLSMVFTARAQEYLELAGALRADGLKGHITAGGHFASFHAEQLIREFAALDSVLHGEGEQAMVDLIVGLHRPWEVAGITCRDPAGRIVSTDRRRPLDDLDLLPFPSRPESFHRYYDLPIAAILAGRGCFANCDFCSINAWHRKMGGKRFRQRSVENVAAEMAELYHQRGVRLFNFHDDNFFLPQPRRNVERFTALKRQLDREGVGQIGIQVKARPDSVEPETMTALKQIGLYRVFLGIESNSVAGLKALGRGITRRQNHEAVRLLKDMGLHVTFNLLMFEPDCTISDLRDNIRFIGEQADVPLNFCRTEVHTGTGLEKRLRRQGRLMGDYFGYTYRITDDRAQLAYEIFREVFTPRNFYLSGLNLLSMTLDYYFHVLRHFYPAQAGAAMRKKIKSWIRRLNRNNVELLEEICRFAENTDCDETEGIAKFTEEMCRGRIAFDKRLDRQADVLLAMMCEAGRWQVSGGKKGLSHVASAAAAVVLVSVVACQGIGRSGTGRTEPVHPPPPFRPGKAVIYVTTQPATLPIKPTTRPATRPTTRPASQPATSTRPAARQLTGKQVKAVQDHIRKKYTQTLQVLGVQHRMFGKTMSAYLEIAPNGVVQRLRIKMPRKEAVAFQKGLSRLIKRWRFPKMKQTGACTLKLTFPKGRTRFPEMCEMAPREILRMKEMAPKANRS